MPHLLGTCICGTSSRAYYVGCTHEKLAKKLILLLLLRFGCHHVLPTGTSTGTFKLETKFHLGAIEHFLLRQFRTDRIRLISGLRPVVTPLKAPCVKAHVRKCFCNEAKFCLWLWGRSKFGQGEAYADAAQLEKHILSFLLSPGWFEDLGAH